MPVGGFNLGLIGEDLVNRWHDVGRIKELQPDVVVLDIGDPGCDPTLAVVCVLREELGTKVIGLNLEDNTICTYRGEQRVVREVCDLVRAIERLSAT